jgi:hypothetical protein
MKKILVVLCLALSISSVRAQYYSIGEDPSNIHWRQINTADFQIVYPSFFEEKAQHFASVLENVYKYAGKTLNHKPHKISVILHTKTVISNGLVSWAPSRMELFTTPPQDIYAQDWMDQLAIHEFRHVVQMDKIESELPNLLKLILGEQAAAAVTGVYLPLWLLEGDAVVAETSLSHSGRGRLPSFEMQLKALTLEKGIFSYDKAYLGSYRDYIPDYYQMGYQMAAGVREKYGSDVWGKVLNHVARNPLGINSFSKALKKNTGKNQTVLYSGIFNNLKHKWKEEDSVLIKSKYERITKENQNYVSFSYPFFVNDTTFFALRYSIDDKPRFVLIYPHGKEKKIFTPGYISEESVDFADDRIFWIERKPDPRWANQEFSLLRIYNIKSRKLFEKRYNDKIFAPSLSFDRKYLSFVKIDEKNNYSILIVSPETGKIIMDVPAPGNLFFITPAWGDKEDVLYSVVLGKQGKSLVRFNPFSRVIDFLLPGTFNNLTGLVQKGRFLFFNSSQSGIDNVYALDLIENKTYQITSSQFGTQDPQVSADGNKMIYSDYSATGFRIVQIAMEKNKWSEVNPAKTFEGSLAKEITRQEDSIIPEVTGSVNHSSKRYSKIGHLFNFHSWAPFRIDTENEEVRPGFSLLSQNLLSTAVTQLGYDYSTINKTGKWFAKFDYSGLYPVIGFDIDYGKGKSHYGKITQYRNQFGQIVRVDTTSVGFSFHELNMNATIKFPLDFTHGKYIRFVQPEFQAGYSNIKLAADAPADLLHGNFIPFTYRVYATRYLTMGLRDLQPEFGQTMDFIYRHTPFGDFQYGRIISGEATMFVPGFFKHHGIRVYGGYQTKNLNKQSFSDLIEYPRGYQNIVNDNLLTIRSDYVLPLLYPDWSLGKLSYIKRISLRMFYDHGSAQIPLNNSGSHFFYNFNSTGAELMLNCHFFRFIIPSSIGIRGSYLMENKNTVFEFTYTMNFSGFRTFSFKN